jgi:hypothetical protein
VSLGVGRPPRERATGAAGAAPEARPSERPARGVGLRLFAVVALAHPTGGAAARHEADAAGERDAVPGTTLVPFRDVAAVVAPASYVAEPLTLPELEGYREVVDALFATRAVLPAPPGTVFRGRDALAEWLELHYFTLVEALNFVDGRVVARVTARPGGDDDDAPPRPAALRLTPTSLTAELEIAELAAGDLTARAAESFAVLGRDAVSWVVLRTVDGAPSDASHASFLLDRPRLAAFEQAVAREAARRPGMRLAVTGPWPPYDFVRMQFSA